MLQSLATTLLIENLQPEHVRTVYPLIRASDPSISLRDWVKYANTLASRQPGKRGILVARRGVQRNPIGAVCYRVNRQIRSGTLLIAEHMVALDVLYPEAVIGALVRALDQHAYLLRCRRVHYLVRHGDMDLYETLQKAGLQPERVTMAKDVTNAAA